MSWSGDYDRCRVAVRARRNGQFERNVDAYKRLPGERRDMDAEDFIAAVRDETKTELSRLGSSKSLYADTEGEMEPDAVEGAIADHFLAAGKAIENWADETDGPAGDLFEAAAETLLDHANAVAPDRELTAEPAAAASLADLGGTPARVGGYLGWALVASEKVGQAVGFFVGQADPRTADDFRTIDDDLEEDLALARETLVEVVEAADDPDDARERAYEGAVGVIEAAYDEYFETLEDLGVNPKPVC